MRSTALRLPLFSVPTEMPVHMSLHPLITLRKADTTLLASDGEMIQGKGHVSEGELGFP